MARLLVSVRSAEEARRALAGGASIIDVKEPANGPLGRASFETWRAVRDAVPAATPVSAALGELTEWRGDAAPVAPPGSLAGLRHLKVGMAGAGRGWEEEWFALRERLAARRIDWIAVVYTDWAAAGAPSPARLMDSDFPVRGVLFDTSDKAKPAAWTPDLLGVVEEFRSRGALIAVAGGLTVERLPEVAPFRPDVVAVRGAACEGGDRGGAVDPARVAALVAAVRGIGPG